MAQHALLSPSSAETWMGCPGSTAMQRGLKDSSNGYSDEGTAAHLLGSTCLETGKDTSEFEGKKIFVGSSEVDGFDGAVWGGTEVAHDFVERRQYTVDEEMIEAVGRYVGRVRQYGEGAVLLMPEQRISIEPFTGEKDAAGTADAAVVLPGELQVHDLKYGMGVRVSAERNKQLMMYALGVREELDIAYGPFERIRIVIHQPRISDAPSEGDCTNAELDAFGEEVKRAAAAALKLYNEPMPAAKDIGDNCLALVPSEDACRWCKAKPTCPALAKFVEHAMEADFEAAGEPSVAEAVDTAGPAILSRKMAAIPLIEDWCKAVRAKVESELFAGVAIPGWKIVGGKKGNKSWSDEEVAEALFRDMRMTIEERCNLSIKSPTQIMKVLKSTPKRLKRVMDANMIVQRPGKPSVAPESDPRPVWVQPDQASDFTATTEEEQIA